MIERFVKLLLLEETEENTRRLRTAAIYVVDKDNRKMELFHCNVFDRSSYTDSENATNRI